MNGYNFLPTVGKCEECDGSVPATPINLNFMGKNYVLCSVLCRKIKLRKLIAFFNIEGRPQ